MQLLSSLEEINGGRKVSCLTKFQQCESCCLNFLGGNAECELLFSSSAVQSEPLAPGDGPEESVIGGEHDPR